MGAHGGTEKSQFSEVFHDWNAVCRNESLHAKPKGRCQAIEKVSITEYPPFPVETDEVPITF